MGLWGICLIVEILLVECCRAGWPQGHGVVTSVSNLNDMRPYRTHQPCQRELVLASATSVGT